LTTRSLAADYLAICRNPLKDIDRWIVETRPKTRSAHAHHSTRRPSAGSLGLRRHALHALRGGVDAPPGGRQESYRLSSRPGAGAEKYDQLRSLRAEARGGVARPLLQTHTEAHTQVVAETGDSASELSGIGAYFNALIAAARTSLSRADAAAVIRSLHTQKILAMRAVKDRRRAAPRNRPQPSRLIRMDNLDSA